jgi:hypothetical protein
VGELDDVDNGIGIDTADIERTPTGFGVAFGSFTSFRTRDANFRFIPNFGRIAASQRTDARGQDQS